MKHPPILPHLSFLPVLPLGCLPTFSLSLHFYPFVVCLYTFLTFPCVFYPESIFSCLALDFYIPSFTLLFCIFPFLLTYALSLFYSSFSRPFLIFSFPVLLSLFLGLFLSSPFLRYSNLSSLLAFHFYPTFKKKAYDVAMLSVHMPVRLCVCPPTTF
jgi:hypothetical protein